MVTRKRDHTNLLHYRNQCNIRGLRCCLDEKDLDTLVTLIKFVEEEIPEGCIACNEEPVREFFKKDGIYFLSVIRIDDPTGNIGCLNWVLSEREDFTPPCGVCGALFIVDWRGSDTDNNN